jgi:hypothetical protein
MRVLVAAMLAALAAAATGCGGSVGAGGDAAALAPDNSLAFVSIDTSLDSDQWHALDRLTDKFPIKAKAIELLRTRLREDAGVDFDRDVRPALGDEFDVAVFKSPAGKVDAVGMLQPRDEQKLSDLIAKADKATADGKPTLHERVNGWTVLADNRTAIDTVKAAARGHSLTDVGSYHDAMDSVPEDALVKAYVNGAELTKLIPESGMLAASKAARLNWVALRATAHDNGVEVAFASKGTGETPAPYRPKLLREVPSDAILYVSLKGLDRTLKQLLSSPGVNFFVGVLEEQLGFRLQALEPVLADEGAFWMRPGTPLPDIALDLEEKDPAAALATLTKLARGIARLTGTHVVKKTTTAGTVTVLDLGRASVYLVALPKRVLLTNSVAAISDVKAGGPSLEHDPTFRHALAEANAPDKTVGLAYVNLKKAVDVALGYASLAGAHVPPEVRANLEPLRAFVAYGAKDDGGVRRYSFFIQTR